MDFIWWVTGDPLGINGEVNRIDKYDNMLTYH